MASSRAMRRSSRMSSPMDVSMRDSLPMKKEAQSVKEQRSVLGEWSEPPLRTPAPSFEDYKGLERHGVLEHMAPLGTLPSSKVKLRLKAHDAPRRPTHLKNGELPVTKKEANTPEPTPPVASRRSEPRKVEERHSKLSSSREREEDQDYKPKSVAKVTATKVNPQLSPLGPPNLRLSSSQLRLKEVVDSAVERSRQLGNPILGLAIKKLWDESLHNRTLAELLDAVLSGKTTLRQKTDFQTYIKIARKQIKQENRGITHSPSIKDSTVNPSSKSPSKSSRLSVARQISTYNDLSDATGTNTKTQNSKPPTSKQHAKQVMETNGTMSKEERPAKRVKRSRSASSLSSLSSLSSVSLDQDFAHSVETDQATIHASAQPMINNSTPQSALGPKLHNFSTTSLPRRPGSGACSVLDLSPEDQAAKRRKLQKTFEDFTVSESGIRTAPVPTRQRQLMYSIAPTELLPSNAPPPPPQQQQQRLRNGFTRRGNRDDFEDFHSPSSSVSRDLVVPPIVDTRVLSRGGTPNQLGRLPKPVRKGARVKTSPTKKRSGGAAQTDNGDESPIGDVAPVDDSNNFCESCGLDGSFVCCDLCPKVFHPETCLESPMDPKSAPAWYCNECLENQKPTTPRHLGAFTEPDSEMNRVNTKAFLLTNPIREFFEGVRTLHERTREWEYADDTIRPKTKTRGGYEEVVDNLKLKDSKDNTILCVKCGLSSAGNREIINCDLCSASWHLDCMDPPLAMHRKSKNGKTNWTCPIHMELGTTAVNLPKPFGKVSVQKNVTYTGEPFDDPIEITGVTSLLTPTPNNALPEQSDPGRELKVRRPKNWTASKRSYGRGYKNNGLIVVDNDPSDEEIDAEKVDHGVVDRFQEKGIKLDFIDRVNNANNTGRINRVVQEHKLTIKKLRYKLAHKAATAYTPRFVYPEHSSTAGISHTTRPALISAAPTTTAPASTTAPAPSTAPAPTMTPGPTTAPAPTTTLPPIFDQHTFLEQRTALSLASMAQLNPDLGVGSTKVSNLVGTLIAEAPEDVIALYEGREIDTSPVKGKGKAKAASREATPEAAPEADPEADPEIEEENPDNSLPDDERRLLEALQELIRRKLNGTGSSGGA